MKFFSSSNKVASSPDVPRGHFAVYVDDDEERFVVPIWYLKHPSFQCLLQNAAEEFGLEAPSAGCLRLHCKEEAFRSLSNQIDLLTSSCFLVNPLHRHCNRVSFK